MSRFCRGSGYEKTGEVRIDGLGVVNLVALPDGKTVIATVLTAAQAAADKEREMFLGLAIHDARAPLRNISFICEELLVDFPDPGDGRNRLVRRIRTVAERTLSLSDDVLTAVQAASMQEAGPVDVELQPLCDLIFATLDPTGRHALYSRPMLLHVERPVLQVILRNLIDNAIRHGGADNDLTIHVDATDSPDGLVVTVSDDGLGFSDATLAYLSGEPLRRGSGFGLYGLRRLVESRAGRSPLAVPNPAPEAWSR